MPQFTETELKQQIQSGTLSNLYLLYGTEGYLKQFYANALQKAAVQPGMEVFNLKQFNSDDGEDFDALYEVAETLPAFGSYMCIVVHDYALDALDENSKKRFFAFLKDIPESTVCIFWQEDPTINPKKNSKWRTIQDHFLKANGVVVNFEPRTQGDVIKLLQSGAKKRGCNLARPEAQLLLEMVGNDLSKLLNEIEKLCNYKTSGDITRADLEALVTKSLEANVFDIAKMLHAGNCTKALYILENLLANKEKPELILGTLISAYVDLYRVKLATEAGKDPMSLAEPFSYRGKEFCLRNAKRDCRNLSLLAIRKCLDALNAADMSLKSGIEDPKIVLEKLIIRLSAAKGM